VARTEFGIAVGSSADVPGLGGDDAASMTAISTPSPTAHLALATDQPAVDEGL